MKQIIKNAIIYKAHLPSLEAMQKTLDDQEFVPPTSLETFSYGFVPVGETQEKVIPLNGRYRGYAFAVRVDTKVVPASAVNEVTKRLAAEFKDRTGYPAGRKTRRELREQAISECVAKAMCRSTIITCLYNQDDQLLFVNTTSKTMADHVMKLLIHTTSSVKTETIHVSGVSNSLTTRVTAWLADDYDGEDLFAMLEPCDSILLQNANGKITFQMDNLLDTAAGAINLALTENFVVKSMGLKSDLLSFKLTDDFLLKGIKVIAGMEQLGDADSYEQFQQQAHYELAELTGVVNSLVSMFEYKEPTFETAPDDSTDVPDTVTDETDEADELDDDECGDELDDYEDDDEI